MLIAESLDLTPSVRNCLRIAGYLHDVGKFCIPEKVLDKPGALDENESHLVRRHSGDGAEFAVLLGADELSAACIRQHHDRFDAPRGRVETIEVLGGQVIHAADALVAMTSDRPYQPARRMSEALTELRRERGRQFAPRVVDAAMTCFALTVAG